MISEQNAVAGVADPAVMGAGDTAVNDRGYNLCHIERSRDISDYLIRKDSED
jgi:hypothetical protein